ncbi:MAG: preprotein translocase subunit YajC [Gammaproteobacteria bacterium]
MQFLIPDALAAAAPASGASGSPAGNYGFIIIIVIFFAAMYFFMIRPQQKRQKQHRQMVDQLAAGDEVVTSGGMLGKVTQVSEQFIGVEVAKGVEVRIQKNAVGTVLPKGTIKHG